MIIYVIISLLLENIVGLLFNHSMIIPLFFLVSLLICYQCKNIPYERYLLYLGLLGFLYDIIYTNVYINSLLFLIIGSLIIIYNKYINNSFFTNILLCFIALIVYEILYYLIYIMLGINSFNFMVLLKAIVAVIPINILYYWLSYIYLNKRGR